MADDIEHKLDEILATLHRIHPLAPRLPVEENESRIRLLRVSEIAFVVTRSEDQGTTENPDSPPSAQDAPDPKGSTDSLVVYSIDGKKYRSFTSLKAILTRYAGVPGILMTHRSYLVNLEAVTGIQTVTGGRLLSFSALESKAKVAEDSVEPVESYLLGR